MLQNNTVAPKIFRVPSLPISEKLAYAIKNAKESAEELKKYINLETAEYYLGSIELLLALTFLVEFFRGYSTGLLTKAFLIATSPIVFPFSILLGKHFGSGIEGSELNALLSMISWAVIVWTGIAIAKYRARQQHPAV